MNADITQELERIRLAHGGFLRPADVVEFAKDEASALHSRFTWDDSEAAAKYRLAEARALIRVVVQVSEQTNEKVRAFVSLSSDRTTAGGYRAMADVLDDEVLADILLQDAIAEVASFKRKLERYRELAELNGLIEAVDQVMERHTPAPASESRPAA
jgi:predicted TIM-barrel fold metal-dependent hydrolase